MIKIILFQPEIPQNTGNIARTCVLTNSELILVKPLGFQITEKMVKRAGLDYWDQLKLTVVDDLMLYLEKIDTPFYFFSSKAKQLYTEKTYLQDVALIFGSETSGIPKEILSLWPDQQVTIPMMSQGRCLNLSNAVAIGIYEVLRQNQFALL